MSCKDGCLCYPHYHRMLEILATTAAMGAARKMYMSDVYTSAILLHILKLMLQNYYRVMETSVD